MNHFREDILPLVRQCYAVARERKPTLEGKLVLLFEIASDPSVGGVVVNADFTDESDLDDPAMKTCVQESLLSLTFDRQPAGADPVTVKYAVVFSPDDDAAP